MRGSSPVILNAWERGAEEPVRYGEGGGFMMAEGAAQVGLRRGEPLVGLWLGDVGFAAELDGKVGNQDRS